MVLWVVGTTSDTFSSNSFVKLEGRGEENHKKAFLKLNSDIATKIFRKFFLTNDLLAKGVIVVHYF